MCAMLAAFSAASIDGSNPNLLASRVHLVDAYPRDKPKNFLFRGNNPVNKTNASKFDFACSSARYDPRRCQNVRRRYLLPLNSTISI